LEVRVMDMKHLACLAFPIVLSISSVGFTAEVSNSGIILGPGAISCGKFLVEKQQVSGEVQYLQWTFGFISGVNHIKGLSIGVGTDRFAVIKHLENYCQNHPLDLFVDAVVDLYRALAGKTSN